MSFVSVLAGKVKGKGLDLAEEAAELVAISVFETLNEVSVPKLPEMLQPIAKNLLEALEKEAVKKIDKIDGQAG